jgi:hypothetical protein
MSRRREQCMFCSMRPIARCELAICGIPICAKHRIRKAGGNLCPNHKHAALVQWEGTPTERFGDRGEALPPGD